MTNASGSRPIEGFGNFMAAKMRQLNPGNVSSAVGIAWYRRETYLACLAIFEDAADYPDTFDEWLAKAEESENEMRHLGMRVVRVEIDPRTFPAWCAAEGFTHVDREARMHFGNLKAMEWMRDRERRGGSKK